MPTDARGRSGAEARLSSSGNGPLPVGTHLLLGGVIIGHHGANILGIRVVNIPGVKINAIGGVAPSENKEMGGVVARKRWE